MWVEQIAKKEIERQGGKIESVTDRLITFSGGPEMIPRINFWSRVWNKMYMLLGEQDNVTDFDTLYDMVSDIFWKKFRKQNYPIVIKASSIRSELGSTPTIQKITKKAIVDNLTWKSGAMLPEDNELEKLEIQVLMINDTARIMLNTSGSALHMRGYRTEAGDAPIKESLAAALVLLSGWKFRESFYDPFCGSGTMAIEALMIARNIAPWLKRRFAFEGLKLVDWETAENERALARKKRYEGDYKIYASDIDPEMIEIAEANATRAGQSGRIEFSVSDVRDFVSETQDTPISGTIVTNPPYNERLKDENIGSLYKNLDKLFRLNPELGGGVITSYDEFNDLIKPDNYKKRKLYNGGERCYFYKRK